MHLEKKESPHITAFRGRGGGGSGGGCSCRAGYPPPRRLPSGPGLSCRRGARPAASTAALPSTLVTPSWLTLCLPARVNGPSRDRPNVPEESRAQSPVAGPPRPPTSRPAPPTGGTRPLLQRRPRGTAGPRPRPREATAADSCFGRSCVMEGVARGQRCTIKPTR